MDSGNQTPVLSTSHANKSHPLLFVIIIIVLALIMGGVYVYNKKNGSLNGVSQNGPVLTPAEYQAMVAKNIQQDIAASKPLTAKEQAAVVKNIQSDIAASKPLTKAEQAQVAKDIANDIAAAQKQQTAQ